MPENSWHENQRFRNDFRRDLARKTSKPADGSWWEYAKKRAFDESYWNGMKNAKSPAWIRNKGPAKRRRVAAKRVVATTAGYAGSITRKRKFTRKRTGKRKTYKRTKRSVLRGENYFAKRGALSTIEVSGTVSDPNCVYLGHSSIVPLECFRNFMYALIRRVYKEAIGYEASNIKSVIPYRTVPGTSFQVSNGHSIIVKWCDNLDTNAVQQQVMNITSTTHTIENVGDDCYDIFSHMSAAGNDWKNRRLLFIMCVDETTGNCRCRLDLQTLKVELYSRSELKIQNVTVPTPTDTTEDAVTNVPLVGRAYHLTEWCPKVADDASNSLALNNQDTGMVTYRAAANSSPAYESWREPPPSSAFTNCKGMTKVRMEPGHIRNHVSTTRKTMLLEDFLMALAVRREGGNTNRNPKLGVHDMIALERLLQTSTGGDGLPIKCLYECNTVTGVAVVPKYTTPMMQKFSTRTQNSLP